MKQILSLFMFGLGGLFFLAFVTNLKPAFVTAAAEPGKPAQCSTTTLSSLTCHSLIFATALWPDVGRQK